MRLRHKEYSMMFRLKNPQPGQALLTWPPPIRSPCCACIWGPAFIEHRVRVVVQNKLVVKLSTRQHKMTSASASGVASSTSANSEFQLRLGCGGQLTCDVGDVGAAAAA